MEEEGKFVVYLRCVIANKATLAGYLLILLGLYLACQFGFSSFTICSLIAYGFGLLVVTSFGLETVETYKKTVEHIKRRKTLPPKRTEKFFAHYCNRVGHNLAIKRMGKYFHISDL